VLDAPFEEGVPADRVILNHSFVDIDDPAYEESLLAPEPLGYDMFGFDHALFPASAATRKSSVVAWPRLPRRDTRMRRARALCEPMRTRWRLGRRVSIFRAPSPRLPSTREALSSPSR
jgi:hypothetical protein